MQEELYHHGILGQKWGIRRFQNKDGSLTAEGKQRYLSNRQINDVHDAFSKSSYDDDISDKVFAITKADRRELKRAKNELYKNVKEQQEIAKEAKQLFKAIDSDEKTKCYYEAVSEIASFGNWKNIKDLTCEDISNAAYMGIFDDGQQSNINAYSMYAYKNNLGNKAVSLTRKAMNVEKEYRENAEKIIQSALDNIGGENLSVSANNPNYPAARGLVRRIINSNDSINDLDVNRYKLYQAAEAGSFSNDHKNNIKSAEQIVSKIKNNKDASTRELLNEATENLGLSNVKAADLTQSDWNRINREISNLRDEDW